MYYPLSRVMGSAVQTMDVYPLSRVMGSAVMGRHPLEGGVLRLECSTIMIYFQLFRRVAAALPGMENTQEKPTNDCILVIFGDHIVMV